MYRSLASNGFVVIVNQVHVYMFQYYTLLFPQSHEIGPGPEFERVGFNLLGRSPLVSHFLRMRELMGKGQQPVQSVGRTEVAKPQYPSLSFHFEQHPEIESPALAFYKKSKYE